MRGELFTALARLANRQGGAGSARAVAALARTDDDGSLLDAPFRPARRPLACEGHVVEHDEGTRRRGVGS